MSKVTCSQDGCERSSSAFGLCNRHYQRLRRHGDASYRLPTPLERWLSKVQVGSVDECWPWLGSRTPHGYGQFNAGDGQRLNAHRFGYIVLVEAIPSDLVVMHLCDNPPCCNWVSHLAAGTHLENMRDMADKGRATRYNAAKTHCRRGHPFDEANTYWAGRYRQCRACNRENQRRYLERLERG